MISAGHPYEVVMDEYCQEEAQVHYEAILRCRAEATRHWVTAIRVANNAKKRDYAKYLKELEDTGRNLDLAFGRREEVETEKFFSTLSGLVQRKKAEDDGNS